MLNHNREPGLIEWAKFTTLETVLDCNLIRCETTGIISCKKSISEEKWQKVGRAYNLGKIDLISPILTSIVEVWEPCQHFHLKKRNSSTSYYCQEECGTSGYFAGSSLQVKSGFQGQELLPSLCQKKGQSWRCSSSCSCAWPCARPAATFPALKAKKVGSLWPSYSAVNMQSCCLDTTGMAWYVCVWYKMTCA